MGVAGRKIHSQTIGRGSGRKPRMATSGEPVPGPQSRSPKWCVAVGAGELDSEAAPLPVGGRSEDRDGFGGGVLDAPGAGHEAFRFAGLVSGSDESDHEQGSVDPDGTGSGPGPVDDVHAVVVHEEVEFVDVGVDQTLADQCSRDVGVILDQLVEVLFLPGVELVGVVVREPLPPGEARVLAAERCYIRDRARDQFLGQQGQRIDDLRDVGRAGREVGVAGRVRSRTRPAASPRLPRSTAGAGRLW